MWLCTGAPQVVTPAYVWSRVCPSTDLKNPFLGEASPKSFNIFQTRVLMSFSVHKRDGIMIKQERNSRGNSNFPRAEKKKGLKGDEADPCKDQLFLDLTTPGPGAAGKNIRKWPGSCVDSYFCPCQSHVGRMRTDFSLLKTPGSSTGSQPHENIMEESCISQKREWIRDPRTFSPL